MTDVDMQLDVNVRRKGRGFTTHDGEPNSRQVNYDRISHNDSDAMQFDQNAAKSIEGWVIVVTNVHEEASEEDVSDKFADFGKIKNLHLNLDRRTGYVKGYALIEFENFDEAKNAVNEGNDSQLLEQQIKCDFAFVNPPPGFNDSKSKARRSSSPTRKDIKTEN